MNNIKDFLKFSNLASKTIRAKQRYLIRISEFLNSIHAPQDFFELKPDHFRKLYMHIDKMEILQIAKRRYRYALKSLADYLCSELYAKNEKPPLDYTFILSDRFYKFRDSGQVFDSSYLEKNDVFAILQWAKFSRPPLVYYAICIQATTGCRVGGLLSLTKDRIDIENRQITLHEKGSDRGSIIKKYVIAKNLVIPIQQYLRYLPEDTSRIFPITDQKFNLHLKQWKPWMHSHLFRDALYSIWEEMGVEEAVRDILQNREVRNIGAKHYLKKFKNWQYRVMRYDEIYPFNDAGI